MEKYFISHLSIIKELFQATRGSRGGCPGLGSGPAGDAADDTRLAQPWGCSQQRYFPPSGGLSTAFPHPRLPQFATVPIPPSS